MDSEAAECVAPRSPAPGVEVRQSEGSRRGQRYLSATGEKLRNEGEKHILVITSEGCNTRVLYQVADVKRPLTSIGNVCDRGSVVVFREHVDQIRERNGLSRTSWKS